MLSSEVCLLEFQFNSFVPLNLVLPEYLATTFSVAFMAEKDATARLRRAVKGTGFFR